MAVLPRSREGKRNVVADMPDSESMRCLVSQQAVMDLPLEKVIPSISGYTMILVGLTCSTQETSKTSW